MKKNMITFLVLIGLPFITSGQKIEQYTTRTDSVLHLQPLLEHAGASREDSALLMIWYGRIRTSYKMSGEKYDQMNYLKIGTLMGREKFTDEQKGKIRLLTTHRHATACFDDAYALYMVRSTIVKEHPAFTAIVNTPRVWYVISQSILTGRMPVMQKKPVACFRVRRKNANGNGQ